jgi:hypothetical protein
MSIELMQRKARIVHLSPRTRSEGRPSIVDVRRPLGQHTADLRSAPAPWRGKGRGL